MFYLNNNLMYFINIYYKYFSVNFSFLIFFKLLIIKQLIKVRKITIKVITILLVRNIIPFKLMIELIVG